MLVDPATLSLRAYGRPAGAEKANTPPVVAAGVLADPEVLAVFAGADVEAGAPPKPAVPKVAHREGSMFS